MSLRAFVAVTDVPKGERTRVFREEELYCSEIYHSNIDRLIKYDAKVRKGQAEPGLL
jgi:hypothetical protein